jgi:hypothetical protein
MPNPKKKVATFAELAALEPALNNLLAEARGHHASRAPDFCANAAWYGYLGFPGLKPRLLQLVGFERAERHPVLSTPAAYDVAYDFLCDALPNCRGRCPCLAL